MNLWREFTKGIIKENPTMRLVLGTCPTLAVTTSALNSIGMGLATMAVLVFSNIFVSLLRKVVPDEVRIPIFVVLIATFVTIISLLMEAFFYDLFKALGIFIPLIVVNCIILGRAEAFAYKHGPVKSLFDALGMGLGFTLALFVIGSIREVFGAGSVLGINILGAGYKPFLIMVLPPGAFIVFGLVMGAMNKFTK